MTQFLIYQNQSLYLCLSPYPFPPVMGVGALCGAACRRMAWQRNRAWMLAVARVLSISRTTAPGVASVAPGSSHTSRASAHDRCHNRNRCQNGKAANATRVTHSLNIHVAGAE